MIRIYLFQIFIFISVFAFAEDQKKPQENTNNAVVGNAVVCFGQNPEIPEYLRKKDKDGKLLHPGLEFRFVRKASCIELFDLEELTFRCYQSVNPKALARATLAHGNLTRSKPPKLVSPHYSSPEEFVIEIAKRFQYIVPFYSLALEKSLLELPDQPQYYRISPLSPIHDEAFLGRIDQKYCVVASLSQITPEGKGFKLEYDNRLLDQARTLSEQDYTFTKTTLRLSDSIHFINPLKNRFSTASLFAYSVLAEGITVKDWFEWYKKLGFTIDDRFEEKDLRHFYPWQVMQSAFDSLWNETKSPYKTYEAEVVHEITSKIKKLKGCKFFRRKYTEETKRLHEIYDCYFLLNEKRYFLLSSMKKNGPDSKIADILLQKFKLFEQEVTNRVKAYYKEKVEKNILAIPYFSKEHLQKLNLEIDQAIGEGTLNVIDPTTNLTDKPIEFDKYSIDLKFPVPEKWGSVP